MEFLLELIEIEDPSLQWLAKRNIYVVDNGMAAEQKLRRHLANVSSLAVQLGKKIGLNSKQLCELRTAALLHDIGKTDMLKKIVASKESPLAKHLDIPKSHPWIGYILFAEIDCFKHIAEIILRHHERYDGTGYPGELQGRKIPLAARIISLADAFDRMTTERKCRPAMGIIEALAEIKACSGTQFDPALVPTFCQIINQAINQALLPD